MSKANVKIGAALLLSPLVLFLAGCVCFEKPAVQTAARADCERTEMTKVTEDLPQNAKPGECYAKVFIPEKFETTTETICVRDASERLEVVPPKFEWVEESVVVKEASTRLEEVPAEFTWQDRTVQVDPGHTGWHVEKAARCVSEVDPNLAPNVYCLVNHEPVYQTIRTQVQVKPATTREIVIPAEYQTVRRQKLVSPATTRRISIPAEYASVQKTRKVGESKVEWQRVVCQLTNRMDTLNAVKEALAAAGYAPGPRDGTFGPQDWAALKNFQRDNRIGVGELTYQTLEKLGIDVTDPGRTVDRSRNREQFAESR